jgi:glycosyltransferase involved in cell wall biosynthesis
MAIKETQNSKTAVIAYSTAHFNPDTHDISGSAGAIASLLFTSTLAIPGIKVFYIDSNQPRTWPDLKNIDYLITRDVYIPALKFFYRPKKTLIILVNQSRKFRLDKLRKVANSCPIEYKSIRDSSNYVNNKDLYMVIGNSITAESYKSIGVGSKRLREVGYGFDTSVQIQKFHPKRNIVLFHIGEISYRKGIDVISSLANLAQREFPDLQFVITGMPPEGFESSFICNELRKQENVLFTGWLDLGSEEFLDILSRTLISVFPTREEGLAGAYLDIATTGIPTFTTVEVGCEIPCELTIRSFNLLDLRKILVSALETSEELWKIAQLNAQYLKGFAESKIPLLVSDFLNSRQFEFCIRIENQISELSKQNLKKHLNVCNSSECVSSQSYFLSNLVTEISKNDALRIRTHLEIASRLSIRVLEIEDLCLLSFSDWELRVPINPVTCNSLPFHGCRKTESEHFFRTLVAKIFSNFRAYYSSWKPFLIVTSNQFRNRKARR